MAADIELRPHPSCRVPDQRRSALIHVPCRPSVNVAPGSVVFTDSLSSYIGLDVDYIHQMIDHAIAYVEGLVHTNGMENFWSLLKRCLKGTYIAVSPTHLFRYLDEETFRFNKRKGTDGTRFIDAMMGVVGKRLQYAELIAEGAAD